jgi:hypothetical protein
MACHAQSVKLFFAFFLTLWQRLLIFRAVTRQGVAALLIKEALATAGSIGFPSKMPGTAYGLSAHNCGVGSKLRDVLGSTCSNCYALKGNYTGTSVAKSHAARLAALQNPLWADAMVRLLRNAHGLDNGKPHASVTSPGWHRWHDSGDVQSLEHISKIAEVCLRTPEIQHWIPSREAGMWKQWLKLNKLPANLILRISATMVDDAPSRAFDHTSTVHSHAEPVGHVCPARLQGNVCGPCRACWDKSIPNVSYPVH